MSGGATFSKVDPTVGLGFLDNFRDQIRSGVGVVMVNLTARLQAMAQARAGQALGGGGAVARSIRAYLVERDGKFTAYVGSRAPVAAFYDQGFSGEETVRQHLRRVKAAFGKPIEEVSSIVLEHGRAVAQIPREFLRDALLEIQAEILFDTSDAAIDAVERARQDARKGDWL